MLKVLFVVVAPVFILLFASCPSSSVVVADIGDVDLFSLCDISY